MFIPLYILLNEQMASIIISELPMWVTVLKKHDSLSYFHAFSC